MNEHRSVGKRDRERGQRERRERKQRERQLTWQEKVEAREAVDRDPRVPAFGEDDV